MNNLIGISGKIGSGKDTVGSILQWIVTSKTGFGNGTYSNKECVEWLNGKYPGDTSIQEISGYQIKKFADKLKDTACLLIGCTREQLEDREFKEKELGEEWWYWTNSCLNSVTVTSDGRKPSLFYKSKEEADNARDGWTLNRFYESTQIKLTPRKLLQLLGTEAGRDIIHPNIWVNALFADYKSYNILKEPFDGFRKDFTVLDSKYPKWVITDCRFPNEAKAIKDRGGIVIRVNRDRYFRTGDSRNDLQFKEHPSETALDNYEFDHVIDNNGSIEELVEKVKQLIK